MACLFKIIILLCIVVCIHRHISPINPQDKGELYVKPFLYLFIYLFVCMFMYMFCISLFVHLLLLLLLLLLFV